MEMKLQANWLVKERTTSVALTRGIVWGLIGALARTMAMDLVLVGGLSASDCQSIPVFYPLEAQSHNSFLSWE